MSADLSRACYNATLFLNKLTPVGRTARLTSGRGHLMLTSSDSIILGQETVQAATVADIRVALDKEALDALDHARRADKKGTGTLELHPGDCLGYTDSMNNTTLVAYQPVEEYWDALDRLLVRVEGRRPAIPELIAFDASRLAKFARVKPDRGDRVMDLCITAPGEVVLVKIGAAFTGLIAPIQRGKHAEVCGDDGLWPEAA